MRSRFLAEYTSRGLTALVFIFAAGCTRYVYEIELVPNGSEIQRTVVAWESARDGGEGSKATPLPTSEVRRLEEVYEDKAEMSGDRRRLSDTFNQEMPDDVGGSGRYTHWDTSLGSASFYVERFRGSDDAVQTVEDRLEAADLAVDMLSVFVDAEAVDSAHGKLLRDFARRSLRSDAKNLALLIWGFQAYGTNLGTPEGEFNLGPAGVRVIQFLVERDYVTLEEVARFASRQSELDEQQLWSVLARKLGLTTDEFVAALPAVSARSRLEKAFSAALMGTDTYRRCLTALPEGEQIDPSDPTGPGQAFGDLVGTAAGFTLAEHDRLVVRLRLPEPPISTNGDLVGDETIEWGSDLAVPGNPALHALPMLCFAAWAEPNGESQIACFGRVRLEGGALGEYVFWRRGLDENEGIEWDAFLDTLTPEMNLGAELEGFRFSTTPADVEIDPRVVGVRRMLLNMESDE